MRLTTFLLILAACGFAPPHANAQVVVPFFSGAGTAFDPEVSVVNSGQVLDAQAVVSNDRKYVTLNMRPSSSQLLALRQFQFQTASSRPLGFVGNAGAGAQNALDRQGMNLVTRLD
jgi:hypothetical protein